VTTYSSAHEPRRRSSDFTTSTRRNEYSERDDERDRDERSFRGNDRGGFSTRGNSIPLGKPNPRGSSSASRGSTRGSNNTRGISTRGGLSTRGNTNHRGVSNSRGGFVTRGRSGSQAAIPPRGSTTRDRSDLRLSPPRGLPQSILGAGARIVHAEAEDAMDIQVSVRNDRPEVKHIKRITSDFVTSRPSSPGPSKRQKVASSKSDMEIVSKARVSPPRVKQIESRDTFTLLDPIKMPGEFFCPSVQPILLALTAQREDDKTPCFERGRPYLAFIQVENNSSEVRHLQRAELVHDAKSKSKVSSRELIPKTLCQEILVDLNHFKGMDKSDGLHLPPGANHKVKLKLESPYPGYFKRALVFYFSNSKNV
jgi:hypothetical protein